MALKAPAAGMTPRRSIAQKALPGVNHPSDGDAFIALLALLAAVVAIIAASSRRS